VRTFGKYRLLEPLASGGMADVWRAETTGAAGVVKEVALKLVRGEHEARSDFVRMFIEEARLASRLSHANVVQVFEFDQVDGRYYIAMELVRGRNLVRVSERARELGARLGLPRAVHVGAEVAKALAYAHRLAGQDGAPLGIVHRDVSPHNVLVSFEGEVKLADFGIARAMSRAGLTDPGTVKGKLAYMAPEQARSAAVDPRADVFALGVVLWELCAGRRLFARDTDAATLAAVLDGAPPSPPSAWNEAVPPELDAVIVSALERDPARRMASAQDLATALGRVLLGLARSPEDWDLRGLMHRLWPDGATPGPTAATERTVVRPGPRAAPGGGEEESAAAAVEPGADAPADGGTHATYTGMEPPRRRPGRAVRLGTAAAVAIAVIGGGGVVVARRGGEGTAPTATATATETPTATTETANPNANANPPTVPVTRVPDPVAPGPSPRPGPTAPPPVPPTSSSVRPERSGRDAAAESKGAAPADLTAAGTLHVTSPSWANVTVDGKPVGETPVSVKLAPGRHRVRASHPRHGAREAVIDVLPGGRADWNANLGR
jgi:tRNA A-37 threonylcarbamoyl transferase component Bud32